MKFAEAFLRLGCALVAWMIVYAWLVWLAASHVVSCGPEHAEMLGLLLGMGPAAALAGLLIRTTRPFAEIHALLRWLGLPLILLLPLAVRSVWAVFTAVRGGGGWCGTGEAPGWLAAWAPVQVASMLAVAGLVAMVFVDARRAARTA